MLGAICSLELSEMVLIEHRKPEENDDGMRLVSSKDAFSSSVLTESVIVKSKPCSKSATAWSKKNSPHTLVQGGRWLALILSYEPRVKV